MIRNFENLFKDKFFYKYIINYFYFEKKYFQKYTRFLYLTMSRVELYRYAKRHYGKILPATIKYPAVTKQTLRSFLTDMQNRAKLYKQISKHFEIPQHLKWSKPTYNELKNFLKSQKVVRGGARAYKSNLYEKIKQNFANTYPRPRWIGSSVRGLSEFLKTHLPPKVGDEYKLKNGDTRAVIANQTNENTFEILMEQGDTYVKSSATCLIWD